MKHLQERISMAEKLLEKDDLPPEERWRVAKLRYLDKIGVPLREKYPELDPPEPPENSAPGPKA